MEAKEAVREYPKILQDNDSLLDDLRRTLKLISEQRQLQIDEILSQVTKLCQISEELDSFLQRLDRIRNKSVTRQYLRAFKSSRQDDRELAGILSRLDRVKLELMARIHITHVGMTAKLKEGFQGGFNTAHPTEEKMSGPVLSQGKRQVIGSRTFGRATVIYGDVGVLAPTVEQVSSESRDCEAWDDSVQIFGGVGSESFRQLLVQRRTNSASWNNNHQERGWTDGER